MEWKITEEAFPIAELLLDDFCECPVDGDFILPDYCPDAAAILKCVVDPAVQSRQISGDRILIEGVAEITVLYLDEGRRQVYGCRFQQSFGCGFTVKGLPADAVLDVSVCRGFVNCRATSPRKLSVHGSFSVKCRGTAAGAQTVVAAAQQEDWQTREATVAFAVPTASAEKTFAISEVAEIDAALPPIEAVALANATAALTEWRQIPGKVILKGEVTATALCTAAEDRVFTVTQRFPFSQLLDMDGLEDGWAVLPRTVVIGCDAVPTDDRDGARRLLDWSLRVNATAVGIRRGEQTVLTDAYGLRYPLELTIADLPSVAFGEVKVATVTDRQTTELPAETDTVLAAWGEAATLTEDSVPAARMNACLLTRGEDGTVAYYERPLTFPLGVEGTVEQLTLSRTETSQSGQTVEWRPTFSVITAATQATTVRAVTGVAADESAAYPACPEPLKVYFAAAGDSLWEIAKRYRAIPAAVAEENRLTADILPDDRAILIPLT